jgi:enamine deaminase RidA (YjgF/YER057c/UK114 family)
VNFEQKISELGLALPNVAPPAGSYLPSVISGNLVFTAGQIPLIEGKIAATGKVGGEVSLERAQEMARICLLNALAAVKSEIGDLQRVKRIVKLVGFVSSDPGFIQQPQVINAASDVLAEIFGEAGRHARSAVGVAVLPLDVPVEIELIVEFD